MIGLFIILVVQFYLGYDGCSTEINKVIVDRVRIHSIPPRSRFVKTNRILARSGVLLFRPKVTAAVEQQSYGGRQTFFKRKLLKARDD